MKRMKVYLDTSVINHLFADDAPEAKKTTHELFNSYIKHIIFDTYVSPIVIEELENTNDINKRTQLINVIENFDFSFLNYDSNKEEIDSLAKGYIEKGILPPKSIADALHVAFSTFYEMDALISWNYKHLANINRERKIISLNITHGYNYTLRICSPMEVMDENNE